MTAYTYHPTPIGPLLIAGDADRVDVISFPTGDRIREPSPDWEKDPAPFSGVAKQLDEYFAGQRTAFDMNLNPQGTEFQQKVWRALLDIPYGETISYGELARRIGNIKASRAVGAANGANPIPVVIPCHRVIGSNKALTGFGGGLDTKRFLLALEAENAPAKNGQQRLI